MPTEDEVSTDIDLTLRVADLAAILEAQSVGTDVESALAAIEDLSGDPSRGQQLYNGLEDSLDGTRLTCFSCHNGETAPTAEGTWTRVDEIRLQDPALEGYTVEHYLVESIIHPNAYVVPGYIENLMPDYFGTRLDAQMLADLVAYLDSQDQLLPTATP
jgi:mono/diheme cytochrome c family protein